MERGRLVRFNADKGYGFIAPDEGEEDIFLHVSALRGADPRDMKPGMVIEYDAVDSADGFKAVMARPVEPVPGSNSASTAEPASGSPDRRAVPKAEFERVLTDVLITSAPSITGAEIVRVRTQLTDYAHGRGWLDAP